MPSASASNMEDEFGGAVSKITKHETVKLRMNAYW